MFGVTPLVLILALEQPVVGSESIARAVIPHPAPVTAAQFAPDGTRVVTATTRGTLRVAAVSSGETLFERKTGGGKVLALAVSRDGRSIATSNEDGQVYVFDAKDLQRRFVIDTLPPHEREKSRARKPAGIDIDVPTKPGNVRKTLVKALEFAPDGSALLAVATDGGFRTYDATTGKMKSAKQSSDSRRVIAARLSPGGKYVVWAVYDG